MAEKFNVADTDSLDRWSHRRAEVLANANVSAAKQAHYGGYGASNPCYGYGGMGPITPAQYGRYAIGTWGYNPYYGIGHLRPLQRHAVQPVRLPLLEPAGGLPRLLCAAAGLCAVHGRRRFRRRPSYPTMGSTAGGYSGTAHRRHPCPRARRRRQVPGASAASSAGSSSAGHGSARIRRARQIAAAFRST